MIAPYKPKQASEHVLPYLKFAPKWFLDCGPGSGVESLSVLAAYPNIKILAIEPSPIGYEAALKLLNPDKYGIVLINAAIWSEDRSDLLLEKPSQLLCSSFFRNAVGDDPAVRVQGRSLDSLDREYGPFEDVLLWMDIEGSEWNALVGARDLLDRRAIKAINLEVNGNTEGIIHGVMEGRGFRLVRTYFDHGQGGSKDELWELI